MRQLKRSGLGKIGWGLRIAPWVLSLGGCQPDPIGPQLKAEIAQLKQTVSAHAQAITVLRGEDRNIWRSMRCTDPQVADFMLEAEKCESGQCPQRSLNRVLDFMIRQKHVLVRLRPDQAPTQMAPLRKTQLQEMLSPQQLSPVSRLLMLTMHVKLTGDAAVRLPEVLADQMVLHMRQGLSLAKETPRLGPFPVTCDEKMQLLDRYSRTVQQDKPVREEPKSSDAQIVLWVFRVDC